VRVTIDAPAVYAIDARIFQVLASANKITQQECCATNQVLCHVQRWIIMVMLRNLHELARIAFSIVQLRPVEGTDKLSIYDFQQPIGVANLFA
jgi:hypothetical protein